MEKGARMSEIQPLKPCPRCAHTSPEMLTARTPDGEPSYYVQCACGLRTPTRSTAELAAIEWNWRDGE